MTAYRKKRKLRRLQRSIPFFILLFLLCSTSLLIIPPKEFSTIVRFVWTRVVLGKKETFEPAYNEGQYVQIAPDAKKNSEGQDISSTRNWIGKISQMNRVQDDDDKVYLTYDVTFDNGKKLTSLRDTDLLEAPVTMFTKGMIVQVRSNVSDYGLEKYRNQAAKVTAFSHHYASKEGGYQYTLLMDDGTTIKNVPLSRLQGVYQVELSSTKSATENNQSLRQAFDYARQNPGTILGLPSGSFRIGSHTPATDYQLLASNTQLRGSDTTLIVEGTAYWFGLATGPKAEDGVSHFTMADINFVASDLVNGSHFMIMTDHGSDWNIRRNSFTMVHKKGSHVFDLGSLQNSLFEQNEFIGYAPDLTSVSSIIPGSDLHDYYAEAIQFDAANALSNWDGGLIRNIDPNYYANNPEGYLSNNITVKNNAFLPYINNSGTRIAYGASIGQHSSRVGKVEIVGNTFIDSLVSRYKASQQTDWVLKPIHFPPGTQEDVHGNTIQ